jgi:hypothetical protein
MQLFLHKMTVDSNQSDVLIKSKTREAAHEKRTKTISRRHCHLYDGPLNTQNLIN